MPTAALATLTCHGIGPASRRAVQSMPAGTWTPKAFAPYSPDGRQKSRLSLFPLSQFSQPLSRPALTMLSTPGMILLTLLWAVLWEHSQIAAVVLFLLCPFTQLEMTIVLAGVCRLATYFVRNTKRITCNS